MKRLEAIAILEACGVPLASDFHALSSSQVDRLLEAAIRAKYRKPVSANGSLARYFHARLERAAKPRAFRGWVRAS